MSIATIKITAMTPLGGHLPQWLVTAEVLRVHEGEVPDRQVEFLVHSPSRAFRTSEPIGQVLTVSWPDDADSPYAGPFTLVR